MRYLSHLGSLFACLSFSSAVPSAGDAQNPTRRAPGGTKSVIIQLFEWSWDNIAAECTNFIGPAGYGFVQVSPPQEHVQGPEWWTDYQPVSYTLTSKRGNRLQFQNMINVCHAAGVKVIADTIMNHMAGSDTGTGVAGSNFTHYNYPGIYQTQDFHHCGLEPGDDIANYGSRAEVQTCELVNLADLATGTDYVRSRLATYLNDLLALGVDGLRLDAAKHIASDDIANILSRLTSRPYITQEVIYGDGDVIQPSEYTPLGDVQEFRYTIGLRDAFLGGGISNLRDLDSKGWIASSEANFFVANHDTERNGGSLNINSPSNTYILATIFSLAHPYGTPTILSSYTFSDFDAGAPDGGAGGSCSATGGSGGWLCQHRFIAISGMVGFRNTVGSTGVTDWVSPQSQQIAFGRGNLGFIAINNADSLWSASFSTSLADGRYCDVISGAKNVSGSCTGQSFTVSNGQFSANIKPRDALAIHTGALGSNSGSTAVTLKETVDTIFGQNIFLVGSIPQLGSWNPEASIALSAVDYPVWRTTISLPPGTNLTYKFIRRDTDGSMAWESDPDRQLLVISNDTQVVESSWR